jgi:Domain of unknown function (DUF4349)
MKRIYAVIIAVLCMPVFAAEKQQLEFFHYEFEIVVPLADIAVKDLITTVRASKGIILSYTDHTVVFRIPRENTEKMIEIIKKTGFLDDEKIQRSDVGEELARLKAQRKVKDEYIAKLYKLTEESDFGGTLNAEKAIEEATVERDALTSSIKRLERMSRYAECTVNVNGPTELPNERNRSRWGFINTMGVEHSTGIGK